MSDDKYFLNRDATEGSRLDKQHGWVKELTGCTLHPSIPLDRPSLRIADIATGTAVWLLDLAKILPTDTRFDGFDISTAQFPSRQSIPENVTLHEHNIIEPFPERFHETFDIVAVSFISAGLRGDDWDAIVGNLQTLLKPGGFIQWIEPLHFNLRIYNEKPGAPNAATREALGYFLSAQKILYPGSLQLPSLFRRHKLQEVATEVFPTDHHPDRGVVRQQGKELIYEGCRMLMPHIVKEGVSPKHVMDVARRAGGELDGDLYLHLELELLVVKKGEA